MNRIEQALATCRDITLWVLQDNQRALGFYEKIGYRPDGAEKEIQLTGRSLTEIRLRKTRTMLVPPDKTLPTRRQP
jgi:ribosomal protein S18 acetylase RimI-like enzyme